MVYKSKKHPHRHARKHLILVVIVILFTLIVLFASSNIVGDSEIDFILKEDTALVGESFKTPQYEVCKQSLRKEVRNDKEYKTLSRNLKKKYVNDFMISCALKVDVTSDNIIENKVIDQKGTFEKVPDDLYNGCYVEFATKAEGEGYNGGEEVFIEKSINDCQSYSLAFQFGRPEDALRLAMQVAPDSSDTYLGSEVNNRPENRVYFVKYKDYTQQSQKGGSVDTFFRKTDLNAKECTSDYFFGMHLYCFNGVVVPDVGILKDQHYSTAIAPLVFLKISGKSSHWNTLTMEQIHPFDFILEENVEFVDGTMLLALNAHLYSAQTINDLHATDGNIAFLEIKNVQCQEERGDNAGAANFQFRSQDLTIDYLNDPVPSLNIKSFDNGEPYPSDLLQNFINDNNPRFVSFFCREDGLEWDRRMFYAGIFYHEANHKLFGPHKALCSDEIDTEGDETWQSVYGAHINYLFKASENTILTCEERNYLYDKAEWEFEHKLCGASHSYEKPDCEEELTSESGEKGKDGNNIITIIESYY
jgi:hypothetical protein